MANVVPYLFCARFFSPLFFMRQQVHTQPVVTTASSTTDKPNRAPRTASGVMFTSDLSDVMVEWDEPGWGCAQDGLIAVVVVAVLHWMVCWDTAMTNCEQAEVAVTVEVAMMHWLEV